MTLPPPFRYNVIGVLVGLAASVAVVLVLVLAGRGGVNANKGVLIPPDATEVVRHGSRWTSFRLLVGGTPRRFVLYDSGLGHGRVAQLVELREGP